MNSNCSLLIFLINSQRDVLSVSACVCTRLDCHTMGMGMGTGREGGQLPSSQKENRARSRCLLCAEPLCHPGPESQTHRTVINLPGLTQAGGGGWLGG